MAVSKQKKRVQNIGMIAAAAVIVVVGIALVAFFKGGDASLTSTSLVGTVNVERDGLSIFAEDGTELQDGDVVSTASGSHVAISSENLGSITLHENSQAIIQAADSVGIALASGAGYGDISPEGDAVFNISLEDVNYAAADAVVAVSRNGGSASIQVLSGSITNEKSGSVVDAGKEVSISLSDSGSSDITTTSLSVNALSDFAAEQALASIDEGRKLCFNADDINSMVESRAAELSAYSSVRGKAIAQTESAEKLVKSSEDASSQLMTCVIEIRCDTILDNLKNLEPGKDKYVPSSGMILEAAKVQFAEGDTVFDVLKAACDATETRLEYSYTPLYGSYYVEGINNLYEFDCGNESGWMFKVNGWSPNYGSSSCKLKDGDVVSWCYTCSGLGADVDVAESDGGR